MKRLSALTLLFVVVFTLLAGAQDAWILTMNRDIGPWTVSYLQRGIDTASQAGASVLVLTFATPGGLLDSAVEARRLLLEVEFPTVAYVDAEALSAGAMLALACDTILFAPGGVLGAATPVVQVDNEFREASEKTISAIRTLFRASAEITGRPPEVAEAMVDRDIIIPSLIEAGKLLTLSSSDAATWGYSEGEVPSIDAWLTEQGYVDIERLEVRWFDRAVDLLTSPILAGILIGLGLLGLIVEMLAPGFGVPGLIGILCLGAFFWAHILVGFAGWESIAFLLGGVIAVLLEIFVFTAVDFGLTGLLGLVLIGFGFYSAMVGPLTSPAQTLQAVAIVTISVVASLVLGIVLLTRLPKSRLRLGGMILSTAISGRVFGQEVSNRNVVSWVGRSGTAVTDLRPIGVGEFSGERTDVICEEGHLPKGTPIVVIIDQGYRRVVHRHTPSKEG